MRIIVTNTTPGLTRASSAVARPISTLVISDSSAYIWLDSRSVSMALTRCSVEPERPHSVESRRKINVGFFRLIAYDSAVALPRSTMST